MCRDRPLIGGSTGIRINTSRRNGNLHSTKFRMLLTAREPHIALDGGGALQFGFKSGFAPESGIPYTATYPENVARKTWPFATVGGTYFPNMNLSFGSAQ